jgi:hypothetical protein
MATTTNALPVVVSEAHEGWQSAYALRFSMYEWASAFHRHADRYAALQRTLGVDDAVMKRVLRRYNWYLDPDTSYPTLQAYIDATHAALTADVSAYQAEVAAAEAAHRKRRRAELKAERAAEPPSAPERVKPPREAKRARASA